MLNVLSNPHGAKTRELVEQTTRKYEAHIRFLEDRNKTLEGRLADLEADVKAILENRVRVRKVIQP